MTLTAPAALAARAEAAGHVVRADRVAADDDRPVTGIPREHRPEPGKRRVWYRGVAAGKPPRAGSCDVHGPKGAVPE
ncbi:hypothetical protein GE300_22660 [Rhodobacteraceae bacterium 2CG4]|uniref:Uncharacterized protein n=1 Tax=Halovulum marinum TaxID=2662447 RepID=A0A6L5Z8A1_9RHOB|nr:hypothetical protein [Halovulum marinum]MSU92334.1 hypothetical protein [Halovulum marinum]